MAFAAGFDAAPVSTLEEPLASLIAESRRLHAAFGCRPVERESEAEREAGLQEIDLMIAATGFFEHRSYGSNPEVVPSLDQLQQERAETPRSMTWIMISLACLLLLAIVLSILRIPPAEFERRALQLLRHLFGSVIK